MNKDQIIGNWKQVKGTIKETFGKLTDDDITQINGKREQLIGKLQSRYGYAKERAEQELRRFEESSRFSEDESEEESVHEYTATHAQSFKKQASGRDVSGRDVSGRDVHGQSRTSGPVRPETNRSTDTTRSNTTNRQDPRQNRGDSSNKKGF